MKVILFFILLLVFVGAKPYAQGISNDDRFEKVDQQVTEVSKQLIFHPQLLAEKLTENQTNDYDKVRAFYVWIAKNVEYDLLSFYLERNNHQSVNDVLGSGKALCSGFSLLFKFFCDQANIKSKIVDGYAKGLGYTKNQEFIEANHSWNAVFIHGSWYLLDVTWATGDPSYISKHEKKIDLNTYFLMPPEKVIETHLPEDPTWQLMENKWSLAEFEVGISPPKATNRYFNQYDPNDYVKLDIYEQDILSIKRASLFNPRNIRLKQWLVFAYIYKGIAITDTIVNVDFMQLDSTRNFMERRFYTYMDSARIVMDQIDNTKIPYLKEKIRDEINYQKGVFNYELGSELYMKSEHENVPKTQITAMTKKYFEEAEHHFSTVPATSIYDKDSEKYLSFIEDFRRFKAEETAFD